MEPEQPHGLTIGGLAIEPPVLLAPMAGYSDLPFRLLVRRLGGIGLAYTEMLNPTSVLRSKGKRARSILATSPEDRPLGYQVYGTDPALLADAARRLEERGAVLLDINMGCPQRKIAARGAGAGLLRRPAEAVRIAAALVAAVRIPVTVKLRLGWDQEHKIAHALARDLEAVGVAAITVHGRTGGQGYRGEVDHAGIRGVVEAVARIPVIGNGDITSPDAAERMVRETGCAAVMLGRGALRHPWLAREIGRRRAGQPAPPPPSRAERVRLLREHFEANLLFYGDPAGVLLFRKWIPLYAVGLRLLRPAAVRLLQIEGAEEIREAFRHLERAAGQDIPVEPGDPWFRD